MFGLFNKNKSYENIRQDEFEKLAAQPDAVVLDVRTADEVRQGKIKGAVQIDIFNSAFRDKVSKLDPEKTYLVYCRSGNRSGQACQMMAGLGFKKLYNLNGGIMSWKGALVK